ncbi:uncharacterized protein [Callorhinus ursinus]|uniref:uncharacterized protein n=1 Tax=Callorhinus ursinus TaxID=34884 RepID=UPI003CD01043
MRSAHWLSFSAGPKAFWVVPGRRRPPRGALHSRPCGATVTRAERVSGKWRRQLRRLEERLRSPRGLKAGFWASCMQAGGWRDCRGRVRDSGRRRFPQGPGFACGLDAHAGTLRWHRPSGVASRRTGRSTWGARLEAFDKTLSPCPPLSDLGPENRLDRSQQLAARSPAGSCAPPGVARRGAIWPRGPQVRTRLSKGRADASLAARVCGQSEALRPRDRRWRRGAWRPGGPGEPCREEPHTVTSARARSSRLSYPGP